MTTKFNGKALSYFLQGRNTERKILWEWFIQSLGRRVRKTVQLSHEIQSGPPDGCQVWLDPELVPELVNVFLSKAFRYMDFISVNSACCQLITKYLWIQSWVKKDLLVSGKESQTLRGVHAQEGSHLACTAVAIRGQLELGSTSDLSLLKNLIVLRSKPERCPIFRRGHHHIARLPGRESSKEAYFGCRIYGMKRLAHSQIAYSEKGMHDTPCTHNFYSLINEACRRYLLFIH